MSHFDTAPAPIEFVAALLAASRPTTTILTGVRGAGKTTWCSEVVATARSAGLRVAGLLSPGMWGDGLKTGFELVNIDSSEARPFGHRDVARALGLGWRFDADTMAWGNAVLAAIDAPDLLVIDELGPLELELSQGLSAAFPALEAWPSAHALLVVRPTLVARASSCLVVRPTVIELHPAR